MLGRELAANPRRRGGIFIPAAVPEPLLLQATAFLAPSWAPSARQLGTACVPTEGQGREARSCRRGKEGGCTQPDAELLEPG